MEDFINIAKNALKLSDDTIKLALEIELNHLKIKGYTQESKDVAALYVACRLNNEFTPMNMLLHYIPARRGEVIPLINKLKQALKDKKILQPPTVEEYVDYFFRMKGIKDDELKKEIIKKAKSYNKGTPKSKVAGAIYEVLGDRKEYTQRAIGELLCVSPASIRNVTIYEEDSEEAQNE